MNSEFLDLSHKMELINKCKSGDIEAIKTLIGEIDRLQNLVILYEDASYYISEALRQSTYKKP